MYKTYIHIDAYKVIDAHLEHAKRLQVSGGKYRMIKPKYYSRYGYTVKRGHVPLVKGRDGE
jgi:hypothetical protein